MRPSSILLSTVLSVFVLPAAGIAQVAPWQSGPDMSTGRWGFPLVELPSGEFLAAGGVVPGSSFGKTAEVLDGGATAWTTVSPMPSAHRGKDQGVLLLSGEVLIAGGDPHAGSHPHPRSAYRYHEISDLWTRTADDPIIHRFLATLTVLPDSRVLHAGGYSGHGEGPTYLTADLYDPGTDGWAATGTMAEVRAGHSATLLTTGPNAGQVLVVGGSDRAPSNTATSGCELYDPASGTWSVTGSLTESRSLHTATLLPSGQVLVTGGQSALGAVNRDSAEIYDPFGGTWSLAAPMSEPRALHTATLLSSGKILVAGGRSVSGDADALSSAEIYDLLSDSWSATGSMATPRSAHTAALLQDGRVIVAGGVSSGVIFSTSEIFDLCLGDDASGDTDGDSICDDQDICPGFDDLLDADGDTVPDGCDLCPGFDDSFDADGDGVPDGCDQCQGDDASGDGDEDGVCADSDCDDGDPDAVEVDGCGVCGGDDSTCGIFADSFESGDTTLWSTTLP